MCAIYSIVEAIFSDPSSRFLIPPSSPMDEVAVAT
jgi:hypothetical protein